MEKSIEFYVLCEAHVNMNLKATSLYIPFLIKSSFNNAHEPIFLKATKENDTESISKWGIMITLMMMITLGDKTNQGSIDVKVDTNL